MKLFRATTTVDGHEYVDWYEASNEAMAHEQWSNDRKSNGLPDRSEAAFVECDPFTLKPVNQQQRK